LNKNDLEKIERYVRGVADNEEKTWVESLFLNGEENDALQDILESDWDVLNMDASHSEADLSHLLDRVHHLIRKNEILKRKKPLQRFVSIYMRAAAILLIPLLITGGLIYNYLGNQRNTSVDQSVNAIIYAPLGARVSFNLPDGTTGMLNSGSNLSYSLPFYKNRKVRLNGEAWFEVSHDGNNPFEINTGNSVVRVLGTSFNLSAYPEEKFVEVVLKQGKVEFLDNNGKEKVLILPSERLVFQNGNISKSVADPAKYNAWTEGKLVFRGDPMDEVARRIERWYNVKVNLADIELEKYSFRATFEDDKLEDVLLFLSMTSPIRYRITPRQLLPDGTYDREKVTIYMKSNNDNM
jgi:transmembrane sensor